MGKAWYVGIQQHPRHTLITIILRNICIKGSSHNKSFQQIIIYCKFAAIGRASTSRKNTLDQWKLKLTDRGRSSILEKTQVYAGCMVMSAEAFTGRTRKEGMLRSPEGKLPKPKHLYQICSTMLGKHFSQGYTGFTANPLHRQGQILILKKDTGVRRSCA